MSTINHDLTILIKTLIEFIIERIEFEILNKKLELTNESNSDSKIIELSNSILILNEKIKLLKPSNKKLFRGTNYPSSYYIKREDELIESIKNYINEHYLILDEETTNLLIELEKNFR